MRRIIHRQIQYNLGLLLFAVFLSFSSCTSSTAFKEETPSPVSVSVSVNAPPQVNEWRELKPQRSRYELEEEQCYNQDAAAPPRRLLWTGRYDETLSWMPETPLSKQQKQKNILAPHPLRTNLWQLNIAWYGRRERRQPKIFGKDLHLEFALNGFVKISTASSRKSAGDVTANANINEDVIGLGTWEVFPWGVWFTLEDFATGYEYTFTSGLHLNPFGEQPKLMQGSIVRRFYDAEDDKDYIPDALQDGPFVVPRSRNRWFRPVVGSFSGTGRGVDTADFSYANRAVGLSQ